MKDQLISFETAKLAKEKGFWSEKIGFCSNYMNEKGQIFERFEDDFIYPAPTQSSLQKWLREIHNIEVFVKSEYKNTIKIGFYYGGDLEYSKPIYKTYEEALEKGLQKALKLIKS